LVSVAAAVLMRSRNSTSRESINGSSAVSLGDLLDASRRMTTSLDAVEISSIALGEARRLVGSEGGLVVRRQDGELHPIHGEPASLFALDQLDAGSLRRVVETGRSTSAVSSDEPALVEVPMAIAAVPIVADGTVAGAILLARVATRPFDRDDMEALEMLAPLVGSALHAAATHGSATELAEIEPMTGLKNRRRLDQDLADLGTDGQMAYVMLDVDHFKNFNDINGHAAGDEALRRVAGALSASVRPGDVVYRYGGEEFCVLLPGATTAEARDVAERARLAVESADIPGAENQPGGVVTVSIGVADTATASADDLVERADAALYEAKRGGRNRVCVDS
ncbi:MAG: diguanylate cyclase domain-containing protein, partial [Acidimicrobiales bacterium]